MPLLWRRLCLTKALGSCLHINCFFIFVIHSYYYIQDHLGDVVFVELPEVGTSVTQGNSFGAVESVKATSDVNSPVSGKVVEVNEELNSSPGLVSHLMPDMHIKLG